MTKTSVFLKNASVSVTVLEAKIELQFQKGSSVALMRNIAIAEIRLDENQQQFAAEETHKVPKSDISFCWRLSRNGFVEIDFAQKHPKKRVLYKPNKGLRIKRL